MPPITTTTLIKHIALLSTRLTHMVTFPLSEQDHEDIYALKDVLRHHSLSRHLEGIAIAAPQLDIQKRLFLMGDIVRNDDYRLRRLEVIINPTILSFSEDTSLMWEGCLSYPQYEALVQRPVSIQTQYQNMQGKVISKRMRGNLARVFQHEYEHLEGSSFKDQAIEFRDNPRYAAFLDSESQV